MQYKLTFYATIIIAISPLWATPPFERDPSVLETRGRDAVKRPIRSANMEAISLLTEVKPASKVANLDLPGDSVSGMVEQLDLPFQFCPPPHHRISLGPLRGFLDCCWRSHFFQLSLEKGAQWVQGLLTLQSRGRHFKQDGCGSKSDIKVWHSPHIFCPFLVCLKLTHLW